MTIRHYNETFLKELARLNPAQREAVEHIEGPVLVIAGPGTGKTHILAARIGRILLETDTQPHNILCLTFTDAGVLAMRQRLLELIGPEAHRVHIFTFHSFCNTIIQDNLELFGRRELEPLSDLERVEAVRRLLDELSPDHPLKKGRADTYFYEKYLHNLFRTMKTENWAASFVSRKIDDYLADLPNREEFIYKVSRGSFNKGDPKTAQLEAEQQKMERLRAAAALFTRYEQLLEEHRRYDYEDMILWVLRAFQQHPALLSRYQEQYLYFLVDEYQDTNGAQNAVLQRLVEYWDSPNVFIVGDDDQSIYEFQGARLKNISDFYDNYRHDLKLVVLNENYRSSQHILDTSRALIDRNDIRIVNNLRGLGIEKILTARHDEFAGSPVRPTLVEYPDRLHEEVDIVAQIEALSRDGFPLDEVAVIYAKHRQARRLMELLARKGIPYRTRRSVNILDLPLIQNLRTLLDYLHTEFHKPYSGEHLLFRILHFDCFGILPQDLAKLAVHLARRNDEAANNEAKKQATPWRNLIGDAVFLEKIPLKNPGTILNLSAFIESMLAEYANLSVPAFLERVINRSGLLMRNTECGIRDAEYQHQTSTSIPNSEFRIPQRSKPNSIPVLFTFMSFVKKEAERNPRLSLSRLLEIFRSMDANRLGIPLASGNRQLTPSESAVNLVTAHGSKGLEFRRVFMLDCVQGHWEPNVRGSNYQFTFPDTLTLSGEADALEARRRLFYVAMTRAKEALHISFASHDEEEKELQRAVFIEEILKNAGCEVLPGAASPEALLEAQATLLLEAKPQTQPWEQEAVQALLENFTLSVSSLNQYLRCPLSFYYEKVLNVPVVTSEAASFGIAMHNALRRGFEKMLRAPGHATQRPFPSPEEFVRFFEAEMYRQQGFFGKKEFERRLALGQKYLYDYCESHRETWNKNVVVEQEFRNVVVEGVPLTGIIDRLDLKDKSETHLVDYKTGSHDARKLKRPGNISTAVKQLPKNNGQPQTPPDLGGNYWRQLVFYKILFENWRNNPRRVTSAEISYLEPDNKGRFPSKVVTFEPGDVAFVKNLITDTYARIMRQEFYDGCGEADCSWCNFLRRQGMVDSFAEEEIEALDD
jgi:DNA helicase-2/ATP-dependent DNA helicase PcrA